MKRQKELKREAKVQNDIDNDLLLKLQRGKMPKHGELEKALSKQGPEIVRIAIKCKSFLEEGAEKPSKHELSAFNQYTITTVCVVNEPGRPLALVCFSLQDFDDMVYQWSD